MAINKIKSMVFKLKIYLLTNIVFFCYEKVLVNSGKYFYLMINIFSSYL